MLITPSATGSAIAGGGYWGVLWSALFKAKNVPVLKWIPTDRIINWMTDHKSESLIFTEAINLGTHSGVLGVTFALGGTLVNIIMIMIFLPIRKMLKNKKSTKQVLQGA